MTENIEYEALSCQMPELPFLKGKTRKERLMYPALATLSALLAFCFCATPLPLTSLSIGVPLADAFLCASGAFTPFVFLGNIIGTFFYGHASIERFLTLSLIFVIRMISAQKHGGILFFRSSVISKTAFSAVMAMVMCLTHIAKNGISLDAVKNVLATLTVLPVLTLVLAFYFSKSIKTKTERAVFEICSLVFFACAVYVCKDISYAFCSLGSLVSVFLTLCVAKHGGSARGCICGAILGYIFSPAYMLPYIILGASGSLLFTFGTFSACGIACALCCICALLLNGTASLISFIPQTVLSCAITTPVLRYSFIPKGFPFPQIQTDSSAEKARILPASLSVGEDVKNTARCFYELDKIFKRDASDTVSDKMSADTIMHELCESCPLSPICLDTAEAETKNAVTEFIAAKDEAHIPKYLLDHCMKLKDMKHLCQSHSVIKNRETEPLSVSYGTVCDMLSVMAERIESSMVFDPEEEIKVRDALFSCGIGFSKICVIGHANKKLLIYGVNRQKLKHALPELQKKLKDCPFDLSAPYYDEDANSPVLFKPLIKLKAKAAIACSAKAGETVNGDTAISFCDGDGQFYAMIADGMGSGQNASKSSIAATELIKNFMLCRMDNELAIKLTNEALSGICNECFSSVDLLSIDTKSGCACVTKSHAAPSFILRSGSVYRCKGTGMPLGIIDEATPCKSEFSLTAGDAVIMVSDGIADSEDDSRRLIDTVGLTPEADAQTLADAVLKSAVEHKGRCDDMTVLVIKITAA